MAELRLNNITARVRARSRVTMKREREREHLYAHTHHAHIAEKQSVGLSVQDLRDSELLWCRRTFRRTGTDLRVRVIVRRVLRRMKKSAACKRVGTRFCSSASFFHPPIHSSIHASIHSSIRPFRRGLVMKISSSSSARFRLKMKRDDDEVMKACCCINSVKTLTLQHNTSSIILKIRKEK